MFSRLSKTQTIMATYRGTSDPNYQATRNVETTERDNSNSTNFQDDLRGLKWLNLAAYVLNVVVTYGIGVAGFLNLPTNGELSAKYQTLVTPAGYAFSIWGVIFLAQLVWCLQQFCVQQAAVIESVATVRCNYLFVVLAQCSWTLTFSNQLMAVSAAMMLLILLNLSVIVRSLAALERTATSGTATANSAGGGFGRRALEYLRTVFPFAIHFGWILAASIVNLNVVLVDADVAPAVEYYGGAIGGLLVVLVAALILVWKQFRTAPVVLIWALLGIVVELGNPQESLYALFSTAQIDSIRYGSVGVAAVIAMALLVSAVRQLRGGNRAASSSPAEETPYVRAVDGAGRL